MTRHLIPRCVALLPLLVPLLAGCSPPRPEPDPAPTYERLELANLFEIVQDQDKIPWKPFKAGVDIYRLYGDGIRGPTAALIRFREAGKVPLHEHIGYEHILVLAGTQRDQNGTLDRGTLMVNPPGTTHSVVSDAGCIVLAIYEKPVKFLQDATPSP